MHLTFNIIEQQLLSSHLRIKLRTQREKIELIHSYLMYNVGFDISNLIFLSEGMTLFLMQVMQYNPYVEITKYLH